MRLFRIAIILAILSIWISPAWGISFYTLETFDNILYEVDTNALGSPREIGVIGPGAGPDLSELVLTGGASQSLFTFDRQANTLQTISLLDASVQNTVLLDIDVTAHPRGFGISPDDILYGVFGTSSGSELRTIDPVTGYTSYVTNIMGASDATPEAITFSADGTLYAVGSPSASNSDHLYKLDMDNGQLILINEITGLVGLASPDRLDIDTLTFSSDGFLYGADSLDDVEASLYRIDPLTAAGVNLGKTGVTGLNGIAAAPAPVPEPSTIFLLGIGLLGLIGIKSRKKKS